LSGAEKRLFLLDYLVVLVLVLVLDAHRQTQISLMRPHGLRVISFTSINTCHCICMYDHDWPPESQSSAIDATRSALSSKLMCKQKEHGCKAFTEGDQRSLETPEPGKGWERRQVPFDTDPDWPQELQ
jgi:hypothetical protein